MHFVNKKVKPLCLRDLTACRGPSAYRKRKTYIFMHLPLVSKIGIYLCVLKDMVACETGKRISVKQEP